MFNFLRKLIPGGIHPPQRKSLSNQNPIQFAGIPDRLYIPLESNYTGTLTLDIEIGQTVLKGQRLAHSQNDDFSAIHAPTSGKIIEIASHPFPHPSGMNAQTIVLETDGQDKAVESLEPARSHDDLTSDEIITAIKDAGIIGMGGAGYPTYLKTKFAQNVETLIINGAECEPFITCDDRTMRDFTDEVISGARLLQKAVNAQRILFAIEDNKPEAARILAHKLENQNDIELRVIETIYPTGGQKQLVQILFGFEVETGKHLPDYGLQMFNIATARAAHYALIEHRPVTSRVVTVTGENIHEGQNFEALIGTPFNYLINQIAPSDTDYSVIMGGPMMGVEMPNSDVPVVKTTNCILLKKPIKKTPHMPCIRCGSCADACPMSLMPQQMYWYAKEGDLEKTKDHAIFDCIECGCCAYVCPSEIPLVQYYRHAKAEIKADDLAKKKAEIAKQRHEAQLARVEAEKKAREERLAKKKAAVKQQHTSDEAKDKVAANAAAAKARAQARARAQIEKAKAQETQPADSNPPVKSRSNKPSGNAAAVAKAKALAKAKAKAKAQKKDND